MYFYVSYQGVGMAQVTVIIATYNRGHCLEAAVESVLQQTFRDVEIIIADDGSTDNTAAIVEQYLRPHHALRGRVQYFQQPHEGKSIALNNAISRANSEWIAFLDSDDVWLPEKLERQFLVLERFPDSAACFTDYTCVNNPKMDTTGFRFHGQLFGQRVGRLPATARVILDAPFISIVTLVCKASLIDRVGGFDPQLRFTEDYDFLFRLALLGDFCFVNAPLVMVDRSIPAIRHTGTSAIWDDIEFRLKCEQYRYEKWLALDLGLSRDMHASIKRKLRAVHSSWANEHLQRGEYDRAADAIIEAVKYQVTPNLLVKLALTRTFPSTMRRIAGSRNGFKREYF